LLLGGVEQGGVVHLAIKVVRRRAVGAGKPSAETVYAITSLDCCAADSRLLANWLWGTLGDQERRPPRPRRDPGGRRLEDRTRCRAQLMAALRNTAANVARLAGHTNIAAAQRDAAWSPTITDALRAA